MPCSSSGLGRVSIQTSNVGSNPAHGTMINENIEITVGFIFSVGDIELEVKTDYSKADKAMDIVQVVYKGTNVSAGQFSKAEIRNMLKEFKQK